MIRLAAAVALVVFALPASAQNVPAYSPDCGRIESFLDRVVSEGRTVGASALVWKDGAEACFESAGDADREAGARWLAPMLGDVDARQVEASRQRHGAPVAGAAAFEDYRMGGVTLSAKAIAVLKRRLAGEAVAQETSGMSKGEWREFVEVWG